MSIKPYLFLMLATALLASGCLGSGSLSPEEEVELAMERLEEGMSPNGDVKSLSGEFTSEEMTMDMEIEFGSNDALRIRVDGGMFQVVITCIDDHSYLAFAGETYAGRFDEEMCSMAPEDGPELGIDEEAETEILSIEQQEDGTLSAEIRQIEDGEETLIHLVVRDGRVIEMEMEEDEFRGSFVIDYGTRRTFSVPEADGRIPVSVDWSTTFTPGTYDATVGDVDAEAPLHEFEVRVYEYEETPIASFPLDQASHQSEGGFQFTYHDDGDGLLSQGDRFVLERSGWEWEHDYEVAVYDEWAGMRTDEHPIPLGAEIIGVSGVLLLAAIAILRQRETLSGSKPSE